MRTAPIACMSLFDCLMTLKLRAGERDRPFPDVIPFNTVSTSSIVLLIFVDSPTGLESLIAGVSNKAGPVFFFVSRRPRTGKAMRAGGKQNKNAKKNKTDHSGTSNNY